MVSETSAYKSSLAMPRMVLEQCNANGSGIRIGNVELASELAMWNWHWRIGIDTGIGNGIGVVCGGIVKDERDE